jgi:hypothetical protein
VLKVNDSFAFYTDKVLVVEHIGIEPFRLTGALDDKGNAVLCECEQRPVDRIE